MGRPTTVDEMPLQPWVLIEPFEKLALDFVRPIDLLSHGKRYILVCIDYVTKWVEEKSLTREIEHVMVNFLFEEFFVEFKVPREIVTD
jgi:hypothetical protein